jgi:hypothetical protein
LYELLPERYELELSMRARRFDAPVIAACCVRTAPFY